MAKFKVVTPKGASFTVAGGGYKTEFAYVYPLFWAPYSIIGDGGRR